MRARTVLSRIASIELDDPVVEAAAAAEPPWLWTLDAIQLATAMSLGRDLGAVCAYDERLAAAAQAKSIEVLVPS